MKMTPEDFFVSFVEGNWKDCQAEQDCVRRAFNAAVAASHLADHYFEYNKKHTSDSFKFKEPKDYFEYLSLQTEEAFRDIRSISNAYKHLYLDKDIHSPISSCGSIESLPFNDNDCDLTEIFQDKVVQFTRKDGSRSEFFPVLDKVVSYWRNLFHGKAS